MSDENQLEIPQSFMALFIEPGRSKPNAIREVVSGRYELCEDMAVMLTETARNVFFDLGITERDVLARIRQGLVSDGSGFNERESAWITRRLAEMLDWAHPVLGEL